MDKLLKLINEYENRDFIESLAEEPEDWIIEEPQVRKEYKWHLWFNGANTVQFPDDMFDHYALSLSYGFIKRAINEWHIKGITLIDLVTELAFLRNPLERIIQLLNPNQNNNED